MDISTENTFTDSRLVQGGEIATFDVSVRGTFTGTVTVQLSKTGDTDWIDVADTDVPDILSGGSATAWYVRAGFKTGDYTSGTATVQVHN